MKIDFNKVLKDIKGMPMVQQGTKTPSDLRYVSVEALLATYQNELDISGEEKLKRYTLATKVQDSNGACDVTIEEVALIKELIGKCFSPLTVGRSYALLEGETE